jgi:hypothetical protein
MFELKDNLDDPDELWPGYEGQCQACDLFGPINDLSLCRDCGAKFERDLIRQRDWDYAASAFGLPAENREELRRQVIAHYGEKLELLASPKESRSSRMQKKRAKQ